MTPANATSHALPASTRSGGRDGESARPRCVLEPTNATAAATSGLGRSVADSDEAKYGSQCTPYHRTVHRYSPFSRSMPRQWTSATTYAVTTFKSVNASKIWSMSMLLIARPRFRGSGSTVGCCFALSVLYFWGEAEQRQEERKGGQEIEERQEIEDGGKRRNRRGRDPSGVASVSPV